MKIMQKHYHSTIYYKVKGITEKKVDFVYVMICSELWEVFLLIPQLQYKVELADLKLMSW